MVKEKLGKLYETLTASAIRTKTTLDGIKEDERAMEIIQVVMLIAVGVIAIAAVWTATNGLLATWWAAITAASGTQETVL